MLLDNIFLSLNLFLLNSIVVSGPQISENDQLFLSDVIMIAQLSSVF